jgi:hypothetical protein
MFRRVTSFEFDMMNKIRLLDSLIACCISDITAYEVMIARGMPHRRHLDNERVKLATYRARRKALEAKFRAGPPLVCVGDHTPEPRNYHHEHTLDVLMREPMLAEEDPGSVAYDPNFRRPPGYEKFKLTSKRERP